MISAHHVLLADALYGQPVIVAAMARELGYWLVRTDTPADGGVDMADILWFAGVSGDLAQKFSQFLENGRIDPDEAPLANDILEHVIAQARRIQGKLPEGSR